MENVNEEKSLVKVDNGIFSKIRRFFRNIFSKRNVIENTEELINETYEQDKPNQVNEYSQPKLFNYDNPQNYYERNVDTKTENMESNVEINAETEQTNVIERNEENIADKQETQQYIGISKYFEDVDENYIGNSRKKAQKSDDDGYGDKDELEQKLMNYYASIKKSIQ